jgi:hypothetical protein
MHPELISALAAEHRRDLAARVSPGVTTAAGPTRAPARRRPARRAVPRLHVSWTRTTLLAVADARRSRSWVIVISATRPL